MRQQAATLMRVGAQQRAAQRRSRGRAGLWWSTAAATEQCGTKKSAGCSRLARCAAAKSAHHVRAERRHRLAQPVAKSEMASEAALAFGDDCLPLDAPVTSEQKDEDSPENLSVQPAPAVCANRHIRHAIQVEVAERRGGVAEASGVAHLLEAASAVGGDAEVAFDASITIHEQDERSAAACLVGRTDENIGRAVAIYIAYVDHARAERRAVRES